MPPPPGLRLLPGRFMVIQQAMGVPASRPAVAQALRRFVEEMKAGGFVAEALQRHGIQGASVAPSRRARRPARRQGPSPPAIGWKFSW
jgi:polar amino acid transport system substrate-binding protein